MTPAWRKGRLSELKIRCLWRPGSNPGAGTKFQIAEAAVFLSRGYHRFSFCDLTVKP